MMADPNQMNQGTNPQPVQQPGQGGPLKNLQGAMQLTSQILYNKKVFNGLVEGAKNDPVAAMASTGLMILDQVESKIGDLQMEELFGLMVIMITDVADALQQGGVELNSDFVMKALSSMVQMWLQSHPNRFSQDQIQQGMVELNALSGDGQPAGGQVGQPSSPQVAPAQPGGSGYLIGG